uniref:Uncharacterized protein n=1 Tax=Nelumbo nucifera TaxID=4432 RepID=A0A822XJ02_NELNU|nr:TPA_asm: hypothetical protein HUJ06_021690 [Nelumbo nucifera]
MNRRSSIAADGGRVCCMGSVWWKEQNRKEEMRPFCPRPVRIRVNRPIEPTRPR